MYIEDLDNSYKQEVLKCEGTVLQALQYNLHILMERWDDLEMVEDKDGGIYAEQDNNLLMQDMLRKLIVKARAEKVQSKF